RAQNQRQLVFELEVFDYRERFECFPKSNAVGKNATVVLKDFVYRAFDSVALKLEKGVPDQRVDDFDVFVDEPALLLLGEKLFENVKKRFVIDKLGSVIAIDRLEVSYDFAFDVSR